VFLGVESRKANTLIRKDVSVLWRGSIFDDDIVCVLLQSGHKEYSLRAPVREKPVIVVSTIHGHQRTWSERDVSGNGYIMSFPV